VGSVEISKPHQDVPRLIEYHRKHLAGQDQINYDRALLNAIAALEEGRAVESPAVAGAGIGVGGYASPKRYYQQEGRTLGWHGHLAAHYDLIGKPVDDRTFEMLGRGQDPQGVQHIRKYADSDPFSESAWKGRLKWTTGEAWKRKTEKQTALLREIAPGAKRPAREPAQARNLDADFAAARNAASTDEEARSRRKPKYQPKAGEFDANAIDIRELWHDLGGGRLTKDGRGRAFWRDGKDFNVSVGKKGNNFKDFVSGEGGGTIHLAALAWGGSDWDAAKRLREEYGAGNGLTPAVVRAPDPKPEPAQNVSPEHIARLKRMHAIAAEHFQAKLAAHSGASVSAYLDGRSVSAAVRKHFRLGASDSSDDLARKLEKDFTAEELKDSQLVYWRDGQWRDKFKDRLMIPIWDRQGDVVAFAGRKLRDEADGPKYRNSAESPIYRKSEILYGAPDAGAAQTGRTVVVESYFDAWANWDSGVTDARALCGTALTREQIAILKAIGSDVVLCLDSGVDEFDKGQAAQEKHILQLLAAGLRAQAINLEPAAQKSDSFEYAVAYGGAALKERVNNPGTLVEWLAGRANVKFATSAGVDEKKALAWMREMLAPAARDLRPELARELEWYLQVIPRPDRKDTAGWDMVLATPKSYSLAAIAGGDTRLLEGIEAAALGTLDKAEFGVMGRLGGNRPHEHTGKWAAAVFHHLTARPVEGVAPNPHNHYHCFFFNQTLCEDGQIRSMDPNDIFARQKYLDARFQCAVANVARRCGYDPKPHGRGEWSEIAGYSPGLLKAMALRSEEINAEKERLGMEGAEADDIVGKRLRRKKEDWKPEALLNAWRETAKTTGDDFEAVRKQAEERGYQGWDKEHRALMAEHAIDWAITAEMEHQAVLSDYEILAKAFQYRLDGYLSPNDIEAAYERRLRQSYGENGGMVLADHYRAGRPGERYTTTAMQRAEEECIQAAIRGLGTMQPLTGLTREELRGMRDIIMSNGEKRPLNDKQMWAVHEIVKGTNQYTLINGAAGVGKTSLLKLVKTVIESHSEHLFEIVGLGPTTISTNNLAGVGIECQTFAAFNLKRHDAENDPARYYVCDEVGMLATVDFLAFTRIVRPGIDRVILIGDKNQHQAVGAGRVFWQMQDCGIPTIYLDKIVRQDANPKLKSAIEHIHGSFQRGKEKLVLSAMRILDRDLDAIQENGHRRRRIEKMVDFYLVDPESTLLIAPDNATRRAVNDAVQEALFRTGELDRDTRVDLPMMAGIKQMRKADLRRATRYEVGDVIRWGKSTTLGGRTGTVLGPNARIERGEYTEVVGIDPANNRLKIRTRLGEVEYAATAAQGEVYRAELRAFAVGERVRVTRPWVAEDEQGRLHKVPNGAIGVIRELNAEGAGVVEFEKGLRVQWDAREFPHMGLGYCTTSHSAQSLTFDRVAIHIDTGNSKVRGLVDRVLAYVGFSRAARELMVVTDDKEFLMGEQSPLLKHFVKPTALSPNWAQSEAEDVAESRRYRQVNQDSGPGAAPQQQVKVHDGVLQQNVNDHQHTAGRRRFGF
jgi:DNA primase catalytic core